MLMYLFIIPNISDVYLFLNDLLNMSLMEATHTQRDSFV